MDLAQTYIFDAGLVFFATWGAILAAVSVVAFGRDILTLTHGSAAEKE
jgi:hypothetical protein